MLALAVRGEKHGNGVLGLGLLQRAAGNGTCVGQTVDLGADPAGSGAKVFGNCGLDLGAVPLAQCALYGGQGAEGCIQRTAVRDLGAAQEKIRSDAVIITGAADKLEARLPGTVFIVGQKSLADPQIGGRPALADPFFMADG